MFSPWAKNLAKLLQILHICKKMCNLNQFCSQITIAKSLGEGRCNGRSPSFQTATPTRTPTSTPHKYPPQVQRRHLRLYPKM